MAFKGGDALTGFEIPLRDQPIHHAGEGETAIGSQTDLRKQSHIFIVDRGRSAVFTGPDGEALVFAGSDDPRAIGGRGQTVAFVAVERHFAAGKARVGGGFGPRILRWQLLELADIPAPENVVISDAVQFQFPIPVPILSLCLSLRLAFSIPAEGQTSHISSRSMSLDGRENRVRS